MRGHGVILAAGAIGALLLAGEVALARGALALRAEVAERLDHCKDDEIIAVERLRVCSELAEDTELPAEVRAEAMVNRGMVLLDEGEIAKAMADFDAAIVQNPLDPVAHAYRGEVFKVHGQLAQALAAYDVAISLDTNSADLFANRGDLHRQLGERDKARADFEAALKIEGEHDTAMAGLAELNRK